MSSVSVIPVDIGSVVRKVRVAIYARVSTNNEEQETSYELQVNELIKSIEANPNYELTCVFADKESGMDTKNRPSFNNMMEIARKGGIDLIYTKSVSRFGRNAIEVPEIIRELRSLGVSVFFEKENISTRDFADEFLLNILSGVAEEESRQISSNLRWTFKKKMSKGLNTTVRIYGYKIIDGNFIIVPEEAKIVKQIYDWYIEKVSYARMIHLLHELGIKSPQGNEFWSHSVLESILLNEKYCGDALLGRGRELARTNKCLFYDDPTKYLVRNNHEGIISRDVFDFVQAERKKRTKYRRTNVSQSLKPESKFFYSMDANKHFVYKVERPKGKYNIPVLLCVKNGVRIMFQYKYIVEGISSACNHLLKNFKSITNYYGDIKANTLESMQNELTVLNQELDRTIDADVKLNIYNRISALKNNQLTFESIEDTLRKLKLSLLALSDGYDIEIVKTIFSQVYVKDNHFYLIFNPTNSPIDLSNDINILLSVKVSSIVNYKTTELEFSIVLV